MRQTRYYLPLSPKEGHAQALPLCEYFELPPLHVAEEQRGSLYLVEGAAQA